IYDPTDGPLNKALVSIGVPGWAKPWLGDFSLALPAIGVIGMWATMGFCMGLLLARIQKIPPSPYRPPPAHRATCVGRLRAVTIPGVGNEVLVAIRMTFIFALRIFDIVFVTTKGGPGDETYVPSLVIYLDAFQYGFVGTAAALAVVLGAIIMVISVVINRVGERGR